MLRSFCLNKISIPNTRSTKTHNRYFVYEENKISLTVQQAAAQTTKNDDATNLKTSKCRSKSLPQDQHTRATLRTPGTVKHTHAPVGVVTKLHAKILLAPMKSVTLMRPLPSFSIEIVLESIVTKVFSNSSAGAGAER